MNDISPSINYQSAPNRTAVAKQTSSRTLNVPFLLGSLAVMGVVAVSAYGIRAWQVNRTAKAFLQRADDYEQESKWIEAAEYINRYLQLAPEASQERIRLAKTFEKAAATEKGLKAYVLRQRTIALFYRAIGADIPDEEFALRKQIGELLLQNRRYAEAATEAEKVLAVTPKDAVGLRIRALALVGQYQTGSLAHEAGGSVKIIEPLEQACKANKDNLVLSGLLARAYLDDKLVRSKFPGADKGPDFNKVARVKLANACLDELIRARPKDPQAYLVRFLFRSDRSLPTALNLQGAKDDLELALKWGPKDLAVLLTAAQMERRESERILGSKGGSQEESRRHLQRAHDLYQRIVNEKLAPDDNPLPQVALGETLLELGKKDEALAVWQAGLVAFKKSPGVFHTHLAELWLDLGKLNEAADSLRAVQAEIDQLRPDAPREGRLTAERDQFLRQGIWHMKRGENRLAVDLLPKVVLRQEQLGGDSPQSTRALLLLGSALGDLGDWNQSAAAFDRAATQKPDLAAAKLFASASWLAANRPDLAVDRAEQAIQAEQAVPLDPSSKVWFTLATACFQQQAILPPDERVWGRFEQAIENSASRINDGTLNDPWRADLLRADYWLASTIDSKSPEEGRQKALDVLHRAEAKFSQVKALWQTLPLIYHRLGQSADADRSLDHLKTLPGTETEAAFLHARLLTLRGQFDLAEQTLTKIRGQGTQVDPIAVQREMINLKLAQNDLTAAHKLLEQMYRADPRDLATLRRLADIDLENRKLDQVAKWESAMQSVEGTGKVLSSYFKIRRLILQATSANDQLLEEAAAEQVSLISLRPTWPEAVALGGFIYQRRGDLKNAISAYEQAIDLGDQRISVFEQLLTLLERANRSADAEKYWSRLKSHVSLSQNLTELESAVEIRRNQPERAIEVARLGVARRPKDASAHTWLGRVLLVNNQLPEAEKEFEQAVAILPEDVRSWNSLFSFYLRTGKKEKASETLTRLAEKAKLTDAERSFVLAQGYEFLDDQPRAIAEYKKASQLDPKNTAILLRMSSFYLKSNPEEAEACLEKVLKIDRNSGVARRTLAAILAAKGKDSDWARVGELLNAQTGKSSSSSEDNRLRAILLTQKGGEKNFRSATEILKELVARSQDSLPADRLMLVQLYEKLSRIAFDKNDPKKNNNGTTPEQYRALCHDQFLALCARSDPQPSHLVAFVEYLLRHLRPGHEEEDRANAGSWLNTFDKLLTSASQPSPALIAEYVRLRLAQGDVAAAEKWQAELEKAQPDALPTISLRVRLMAKQEKKADIPAFVEAAAERLLALVTKDEQRAELYLGVGRLYASNEMLTNAETWYRKLYALNPRMFEPLVRVLAEQGRTMEAVQICKSAAAAEDTSRPALNAITVLARGKAAAKETQLASEVISSAVDRFPKDVRLLLNVATLRVTQNRTDDAVKLFRRIVDINPKHVVALNNLATLLAEQPDQRKEALRLIDQAIELTGSEAALFDTKGTILIFDSQALKAVEFLVAAVDGPDRDPRYRFHLALAYKDLNEIEKARGQLDLAIQQNLDKQILTPTEQKMLAELRSKLTP